jgi:hypothetical protein
MISICLAKLLTVDAQAKLLTYRNKYTFNGVEYAPLMYKIIMHLAVIDSVTTTKNLCDNLQLLGVFAATVSGNIDKLHTQFNKNYSQLIAGAQSLTTPLASFFKLTFWFPATTSNHTFAKT